MSSSSARPTPVFGPESWAKIAGRAWSHWDLWFCLEAIRTHDHAMEGIERGLIEKLHRPSWGSTEVAEAKLSHLWDLRARLEDAGITPEEIAGPAIRDTKVIAKARRKLAGDSLEDRAMTDPMRETPRVRLQRRARYGAWDRFPESPRRWYEKFRGAVDVRHHIPKGRTFAKTSMLTDRLHKLDGPRRSVEGRIALYRAFHTAGLELADRADDSYGNVGEMRREAWRVYLRLDWRAAGVSPEVWWRDLCELIVWEPYALDHKEETLPYTKARRGDAPLVESILRELADEHDAVHLRWQREEARQQLAWLFVATRSYRRFSETAAMLGSEHWIPIDAMARAALRTGRHDDAVAIFEAADRPGFHQGDLRKLCRELTGVVLGDEDPPPRPSLRVLSGEGRR